MSRPRPPSGRSYLQLALVPVLCGLLVLSACNPRVTVDPIEVKTIHIVHDINIKVDRELDEYFAMLDQQTAATQPATAPATQAAETAGEVQ